MNKSNRFNGDEHDKLFRRGVTKDDYAKLRASMYEFRQRPKHYIKLLITNPPLYVLRIMLLQRTTLSQMFLPRKSSGIPERLPLRWYSLRHLDLTDEDYHLPPMYWIGKYNQMTGQSGSSTTATSLPDSSNIDSSPSEQPSLSSSSDNQQEPFGKLSDPSTSSLQVYDEPYLPNLISHTSTNSSNFRRGSFLYKQVKRRRRITNLQLRKEMHLANLRRSSVRSSPSPSLGRVDVDQLSLRSLQLDDTPLLPDCDNILVAQSVEGTASAESTSTEERQVSVDIPKHRRNQINIIRERTMARSLDRAMSRLGWKIFKKQPRV